mgnify:CR=1 FL=1
MKNKRIIIAIVLLITPSNIDQKLYFDSLSIDLKNRPEKSSLFSGCCQSKIKLNLNRFLFL